jgi:pilus assembly protein Flp/PilA
MQDRPRGRSAEAPAEVERDSSTETRKGGWVMQDRLMAILMRVWDREEGQAAVEYGVLVALIIAVCVTIIATLGGQVKTAFTTVSGAL